MAEYALPPNTQLTLEEVLDPPWTATHRRWHRCEEKDIVFFFDRSDCFNHAHNNIEWPTVYQQVDACVASRAT